MPDHHHYDERETRPMAAREAEIAARLPAVVAAAMRAPKQAERLSGVDPAAVTDRAALARLPLLRKSDLPALQAEAPPFGGLFAAPPGAFPRLFASPGPIHEPQPAGADPWRMARALHAVEVGRAQAVGRRRHCQPCPRAVLTEIPLSRSGAKSSPKALRGSGRGPPDL